MSTAPRPLRAITHAPFLPKLYNPLPYYLDPTHFFSYFCPPFPPLSVAWRRIWVVSPVGILLLIVSIFLPLTLSHFPFLPLSLSPYFYLSLYSLSLFNASPFLRIYYPTSLSQRINLVHFPVDKIVLYPPPCSASPFPNNLLMLLVIPLFFSFYTYHDIYKMVEK